MPLAAEDESPKRIAIRSPDSATGEALWQAIAEGCGKRKAGGVARVKIGEAQIAVYLITAADLADTRAAASRIAKDPAPVKYLLEPAGDSTMRARAAPAMAQLAKIAGTRVLSSESQTLSFSAEETMQRQAREIVRALKGKAEPGTPRPKTAAPRAAGKTDPRKKASADRAAEGKAKKSAKKPKKRTPGAAGEPVPVAPSGEAPGTSPDERAGKRAAKKAARATKKPGRAADKVDRAAEPIAPTPSGQARPEAVPPALGERAAKKAAKKADRAAKKVERDAKNAEAVAAPPQDAAQAAVDKPAPEERAAKRAAKKAEHAAKKAQREAGKTQDDSALLEGAAQPALDKPTPEERAAKRAAKKAEHAAKKAQREAEKKAEAASAPPEGAAPAAVEKPTPEERAAKRAAKKAEHAAKKAQREAGKKAEAAAAPPEGAAQAVIEKPTPEERAAKRAAKKAEHAAKKAQREAEKAQRAAAAAPQAEPAVKKPKGKPAPSEEERAALRAAARAERKAAQLSAEPPGAPAKEVESGKASSLSHAERLALLEARKARKLSAPAEEEAETTEELASEGGAPPKKLSGRPLRIAFAGFGEERSQALHAALKRAINAAGVILAPPLGQAGRCDIALHTFDGLSPEEIAASTFSKGEVMPRMRIFLERAGGADEVNRAIAMLASVSGAALLRLNARLQRFADEPVEQDALIAEAVLGVAAQRLTNQSFARKLPTAPPDLVEARALAEDPDAFLAQLRWIGPLPKSAVAPVSNEQLEAFAEAKLLVSPEHSLPAAPPVDWNADVENRRAQLILKGLMFLGSPLAYFYAKASGVSNDRIAELDAVLKARDSSPGQMLLRATPLIADFISRNPLETEPKAWQEKPLTARARVLALYVMCCKAAAKRKLKFDESVFTAAVKHLLDLLEALRSDEFYRPRTFEGVAQDCDVIGLALMLRGTPYAARLLAEVLERLKTMQLDLGLTQDCVWYAESYSAHCQVIAEVSAVLTDFPAAEAAQIAPFAAVAKKMTVFAEAMLKSNGAPPVIDDSRQKSYAERLTSQRRQIAKATGKQTGKSLAKRITDTYVFRDAQYFISHSSQTIEPEASLAVLHAEPPSIEHGDPGGIVLAFSHGERDLIVRARPAEKLRRHDDKAPLYAPELRNGYRVDGLGNEPPVLGGEKRARIVKSWRGPGWAAARSIEDTYASAEVARVVIHLKAANALVVVDALTGGGVFEQFFNIGKDFVPPEAAAAPLRFAAEPDGALGVGFADALAMEIERAEDHAVLRRRLAPGVTAAVFQWTDGSADPAIALRQNGAEDWTIRASGKGFAAEVALSGTELRCELRT